MGRRNQLMVSGEAWLEWSRSGGARKRLVCLSGEQFKFPVCLVYDFGGSSGRGRLRLGEGSLSAALDRSRQTPAVAALWGKARAWREMATPSSSAQSEA